MGSKKPGCMMQVGFYHCPPRELSMTTEDRVHVAHLAAKQHQQRIKDLPQSTIDRLDKATLFLREMFKCFDKRLGALSKRDQAAVRSLLYAEVAGILNIHQDAFEHIILDARQMAARSQTEKDEALEDYRVSLTESIGLRALVQRK
jgi:hypothetical protein